MHSIGLTHLDFKPDNVFFDDNTWTSPRIGDPGMSVMDYDGSYIVSVSTFSSVDWLESLMLNASLFQRIGGTSHYSSPESKRGASFDGRSADVWAYGKTFFET